MPHVPCCHIPGCSETARRRELLCYRHAALVPPGLFMRWKVARRSWYSRSYNTALNFLGLSKDVIAAVLLVLWEDGFPTPPEHRRGRPPGECGCPLCRQVLEVAPKAFERRRYRDTKAPTSHDEEARAA